MGPAAWALWRGRDALKPGLVFACYLVLAGSERFLVEFVRRNDTAVAGLTTAQLFGLAMVAGGRAWLARESRRGGIRREDAAAPAARRPAASRA